MLLRFAYGKLVRANMQSFSPATPITTHIQEQDCEISPLGGAGTAAPSTLIYDFYNKRQYYSPKPCSAVNAALSAVTSTAQYVDLT